MTPAELTERREQLRLTPPALAEALGVDDETVRRWESGRSRVPPYLGPFLDSLVAGQPRRGPGRPRKHARRLPDARPVQSSTGTVTRPPIP